MSNVVPIHTTVPVPALVSFTDAELASEAGRGLALIEQGTELKNEGWLIIGAVLLEGRRRHPGNNEYGKWKAKLPFPQVAEMKRTDEWELAALWAAEFPEQLAEIQVEFPDVTSLRGWHAKWRKADLQSVSPLRQHQASVNSTDEIWEAFKISAEAEGVSAAAKLGGMIADSVGIALPPAPEKKAKAKKTSTPKAQAQAKPKAKPAGKPLVSKLAAIKAVPKGKALTREQVDPEFVGSDTEFINEYGHVWIQTAEQRATTRFTGWASSLRHVVKEWFRPDLVPQKLDLNWLRSPKPDDVTKMRDAVEALRPVLSVAEAALAKAEAELAKKAKVEA